MGGLRCGDPVGSGLREDPCDGGDALYGRARASELDLDTADDLVALRAAMVALLFASIKRRRRTDGV